MTDRTVYFLYGFRGKNEVFATYHIDGPESLGGTVNAKRQDGWKVFWRESEVFEFAEAA